MMPMGNISTSFHMDSDNVVSQSSPKNSTLDLIRQYARVCTPLPSTAFSKMIAN